jgi:hypothetical protein
MSGATSIPPDGIIRINSQLADLLNSMAAATPTTEPVAPGAVWRDNGVLTVSVGIPPVITLQPQSQSVDVGDPVTFTIAATNATSYQWRRDGSNISGATSTSYTIAETVEGDDAAEFDCVVTGPGGTVTSDVATLTVVSIPVITSQPTNQTINSGSTATISVTATGATSYQVQRLIDAVWTNVIGATSSSYTTPALTYDEGDGYQYRFVVTGPGGSVNSDAATIAVLLAGDRYISPTGDDSADGLTRETAWGTVARLNTWIASLNNATQTAVIIDGTYAGAGLSLINSNTPSNLTVEFEPGCLIDTTGSVVKTDGIAVQNLSFYTINLRGAEFVGNNIGSANGIGTVGVCNLVVNGADSLGNKATFHGYDDGLSFHSTGGTVDQITINDCRFYGCLKAAFAHVDTSRGTHNRCIFEGFTGAQLGIGIQDTTGTEPKSIFNDCDFVPISAGQVVGWHRCALNRCRIGTPSIRAFITAGAAGGSASFSQYNNSYMHVVTRTRFIGGSNIFRCFGTIQIDSQEALVGGTDTILDHCIFNLCPGFVRRLVDGISPVMATDCVIRNSTSVIGFGFNAHNTNQWNTNGSFIDNCNLFGTGVLAGIAATVTNTQSSDPLIGPADTMDQAGWAVQTGSPCIGAGTSGGNIGFTLADIS